MSIVADSPCNEAALVRQLRAMTEAQQDILLLLQDNNGICHFERIKKHVVGRREPRTSIKSLLAHGLVSATYEQGDWGCIDLKYVLLTPLGRQMVGVMQRSR